MTPLYCIDFSNFDYKFKSVYNTKVEKGGVKYNTSSLYGFLRSIKSNPFKDIVICLDGDPVMSKLYNPTYKGQRLKEPNESLTFPKSELIQFLANIGPIIHKNVWVVYSALQEADQLLSSIAYQVCGNLSPMEIKMSNLNRAPLSADKFLTWMKPPTSEKDLDLSIYDTVIVATTDSDMYQLLELPNVLIDTSTSGKELTTDRTPKAVAFLPPPAIQSYKAIVGDSSDNVPTLVIPMKEEDRVAFIQAHLNTSARLREFIRCISLDRKQSSKPLQDLADMIVKHGQVSRLINNNKATSLQFFSTPKVVEYSSYPIEDIIKEYHLKV